MVPILATLRHTPMLMCPFLTPSILTSPSLNGPKIISNQKAYDKGWFDKSYVLPRLSMNYTSDESNVRGPSPKTMYSILTNMAVLNAKMEKMGRNEKYSTPVKLMFELFIVQYYVQEIQLLDSLFYDNELCLAFLPCITNGFALGCNYYWKTVEGITSMTFPCFTVNKCTTSMSSSCSQTEFENKLRIAQWTPHDCGLK